jgi:sec-independent protein translocase protein TatA
MLIISQFAFLGNFGTTEILVIVVVALLLFGGEKLPELARGLGRGIREFKDASESIKRDISDQINNFEKEVDVKKMIEEVDSTQPKTTNDTTPSAVDTSTTTGAEDSAEVSKPTEEPSGPVGTYTHQPGREPDYYGSSGPYYHDPYAYSHSNSPYDQATESSTDEPSEADSSTEENAPKQA